MATQFRRAALLMAPGVLLAAGGCGLFGDAGGRGPVSLDGWEATQPSETELVLEVPSCNGDPVLDELVEENDEVRVRVVTDRPGPGPQPACLDAIEVQLSAPLGDRRLVDVVSGARIPVRN